MPSGADTRMSVGPTFYFNAVASTGAADQDGYAIELGHMSRGRIMTILPLCCLRQRARRVVRTSQNSGPSTMTSKVHSPGSCAI